VPERVQRVGLVVLALSSAIIGVWATFASQSFYDDFPAGGREWVAADGPYNAHLVRDVGALNLGLTVMLVVAAVTLVTLVVRTAALAALVAAVPHLLYHATHLDPFSTGDQIAIITSLALGTALPVIVLLATRPTDRAAVAPAAAATGG